MDQLGGRVSESPDILKFGGDRIYKETFLFILKGRFPGGLPGKYTSPKRLPSDEELLGLWMAAHTS